MGKQCAQGENKLLPSFRSNEHVTDHNEANLRQTFVSHAKKVTQRWKPQLRTMNVIRSRQYNLITEQVNKIALSANDDKRIIRSDKIQTFARGYRTGWQCNRGPGKGSRLGHEGNWLRANGTGWGHEGNWLGGQMGQAETWGEVTGVKWDRLSHEGNWLGAKKNGAQCPKPLYWAKLTKATRGDGSEQTVDNSWISCRSYYFFLKLLWMSAVYVITAAKWKH